MKKSYRQGVLRIMFILSCLCIVGFVAGGLLKCPELYHFLWGILFTVLIIDLYSLEYIKKDNENDVTLMANNITLRISLIRMANCVRFANDLDEAKDKTEKIFNKVMEPSNDNDI